MNRWPLAALGDVAPIVRRPVETKPDESYPIIAARGFGRGTFHQPPLNGAELTWQKLFQVRAGDLLISNIKAWEGAVGVVQAEDDGCFCSHRYITCVCDQNLAVPEFLFMYLATPEGTRKLAEISPGSADRNRTLSRKKLAELRVPLPPVEEQRRVVARIRRVTTSANEARRLIQRANHEALEICRALLYGRGQAAPELVPVGDLVRQRLPDVIVSPEQEYHFAGVYSFGRGLFAGEKKKGAEFAYKELTRLHAGNFTYPKLMAWEGALGIVPSECNDLFVSPEFPVFELDEKRVLPDVLDVYFRDPTVWPSLKGDSPGTNVRRRRLNPSTFLNLEIPLPCMAEQRRLAKVRSQLAEAARARAGSLEEINTLVASMPRRVFANAQDGPTAAEDRTAA